jgi:hypothetical protein
MRARQAKKFDRTRLGTISSTQVIHAGPVAWLAAQSSDAATKGAAAAVPMIHAAIGIAKSAAACKLAQSTTHFLYERERRRNQGVASWSEAPASIGSVATRPAKVSPVPMASANAAKYVSPMPTMTL